MCSALNRQLFVVQVISSIQDIETKHKIIETK